MEKNLNNPTWATKEIFIFENDISTTITDAIKTRWRSVSNRQNSNLHTTKTYASSRSRSGVHHITLIYSFCPVCFSNLVNNVIKINKKGNYGFISLQNISMNGWTDRKIYQIGSLTKLCLNICIKKMAKLQYQ